DIEILKYDRQTESYASSRVIVTLAGSMESYIGLRSTFGYYVLGVADGGVADKMGVTPGWFIDEVNDEHVANVGGPLGLDKTFQDIAGRPGHPFTLSLAKWIPTGDGEREAETRKLTGSF